MATFLANEINATEIDVTVPTVQIMSNPNYVSFQG